MEPLASPMPLPGHTRWGATAGRLLLASFAALYFELLLIRWAPTTIHALGFFNNLVLIASFLGLGVGMSSKGGTGSAIWQAFFRVAVLTLVLTAALRIDLPVVVPTNTDTGINEMMVDEGRWLWVTLPVVLLAVFCLVVWATVPFGRLIAEPFDQMERVPAYTVNVAGSLLGVLAFTLVSWLELSPFYWFAFGLALLWAIEQKAIYALPTGLVLAALVLHQTNLEGGATTRVYWSPYYKVIVRPIVSDRLEDGFNVEVNQQFLLTGIDTSGQRTNAKPQDPSLARMVAGEREYHELPFQLLKPRRVLILGAGVGNDAAVALRHGAEKVVAVEIDPVVIKLGQHHPEKPYADQRVEVIYNDARAYLNNTEEKFDLILFATLDAHGLLSSVGNLRLDSFIYTQESLAAAKRHLSDDGVLVLSFGPFREWTQYRQYSTLQNVFGRPPLNLLYESGGRTLVAGAKDGLRTDHLTPGWRLVPIEESQAKLQQYPYSAIPATDDWPHLYIRDRLIPMEYIYVLAGILVISIVVVAVSFREGFRLDGHFFFMGAAFLLMETKGITELALLLGSTWQVNAVVFSVILLMILLANFLVLRWGQPWLVPVAFAILGTALTIHYLWPTNRWASGLGGAGPFVAALSIGLPIFLAALIFATTFSGARLGSAALASNLLGSVFGGVAEFLSMVYGARFLSLLALIMYAAAFAFWLWQRQSRPVALGEKKEEPILNPAPAIGG